MLSKRIIPCLDVDKGRVVKGVNFQNLKDAGDPVKNALFYDKEGADELVFLDITASYQMRPPIVEVIKKVASVVFMPFTVGGGVRNLKDIRNLLLAGADKVSVNTSAVKNPKLVKKASEIFGSQCIVVAIDAKLKRPEILPSQQASRNQKPEWEVFINGGRTPTGIDALEWAKYVEELGAGEILLTSMDYDGTKDGYDLALTRAVSDAVKIPVIASGGAGNLKHFYEAFEFAKADACLAASIFHFREYRVEEVKKYLKKKGINVRLD